MQVYVDNRTNLCYNEMHSTNLCERRDNMSEQTEISIFCENVKRLRKREKMSKKEMAQIMHIGVRSLTTLENGKIPVRMRCEVLLRLKCHFEITVEDLFTKIIE